MCTVKKSDTRRKEESMMINLILEHLQTDTALQTYLAQYAGKPAVFADVAPKESDAAWSAGSHYGQLLLHLQLQEDAAREGKNFLTAELLAEKDGCAVFGRQHDFLDMSSDIKILAHMFFLRNPKTCMLCKKTF